jgi:hypothetical protein
MIAEFELPARSPWNNLFSANWVFSNFIHNYPWQLA